MNVARPISVRQRLAQATAPEHTALHIHPWISKLAQPDLDIHTYAIVLTAYHAFFRGIESTRRDFDVFSEFSLEPQLAAIAHDLIALNVPRQNSNQYQVPSRYDAAETILGALYVLHGAGFGAKTLNANVKTALPDVSRRYLSLGTPTDVWRALISQIEQTDPLDRENGALFQGASETFLRFGQFVTTCCEARASLWQVSSDHRWTSPVDHSGISFR